MVTLHTTTLGEQGSRIIFWHGLFGQGKNWTQVGKALADRHRVTLVDMPNHGRSGWTDAIDYAAMADILPTLTDEPVTLVGHSMGGKAAMLAALRHPHLVERLCVVDVSPVEYPATDEFFGYIDAMRAIDLGSLGSRSDADGALVAAAPDPGVRSFLLQNLRHENGQWAWMPNLAVLQRDLAVLRGWPQPDAVYDGPVLWIAGADSDYITDEYRGAMTALFPRVQKVTVKGSGHWVHAAQPAVVTDLLRRFVGDIS